MSPAFACLAAWRQIRSALAVCQATLLAAVLGSATLHAKTPEQDLIRQALQSGKIAQGQQLLKAELQRFPKDVDLRLLEGVFQAKNGQKDKAIETLKKLAAEHPELPEPHNNLGVLYAERKELDLAKAAFERALQTMPSYTASHKNLMDVNARLAKQAYARAFRLEDTATAAGPGGLITLSVVGTAGAPEVASLTKQLTPPLKPPSAQPAVIAQAKPAAAPVTPVLPPAPALPSSPPTPPPVAAPKLPAPVQAAVPVPSARAKPAPDAAPAPKAVPYSNSAAAESAAVGKAVSAWASAWSRRDVEQYLAAYSPSFEPANRQSRASWAKDRRVRIEQRKFIRVTAHKLRIDVKGNQAQVKLEQQYDSDALNTTTRKTLDLVNTGGRWLIVREKSS